MNPDRTVKRLVAVHPAYDDEKLEAMKALKPEGLLPVRVVDCRDYYMAIEGSHRLAAAVDLRIAPNLIVLAEDEFVDFGTTDIGELFDPGMNIVTAREIVGKCQSHHNSVFIKSGEVVVEIPRQPRLALWYERTDPRQIALEAYLDEVQAKAHDLPSDSIVSLSFNIQPPA